VWSDVEVILATMLGYRVANKLEFELVRNQTLCAYGWENVYLFPDAAFLMEDIKSSNSEMNKRFESRMAVDIPEDEGSTDVLCESLVGLETYALMKAISSSSSTDTTTATTTAAAAAATSILNEREGNEVDASEEEAQAARRRVLLVKWLYVHGFVDADFPATTKFIPAETAKNLL